MRDEAHLTKPPWIRLQRGEGAGLSRVRRALSVHGLETVCDQARCPNRSDCWGEGTATFLLLGRSCTRACRFCAVDHDGAGQPPDPDEPGRVAAAAADLGLKFVVLTSVTRDDLDDGGAAHFAATIAALARRCPDVGVEVLVPDYLGHDLRTVVEARPTVYAHNLEVVRSLTPLVRDRRASYDRSLGALAEARAADARLVTKSSLLLGLGETDAEVEEALCDLRAAGVDVLCLGQYLQPTAGAAPVRRYVAPERFADLERLALDLGFAGVAAGPLVRTSYRAARLAALAAGARV
jgi:lipoic acid synthetase